MVHSKQHASAEQRFATDKRKLSIGERRERLLSGICQSDSDESDSKVSSQLSQLPEQRGLWRAVTDGFFGRRQRSRTRVQSTSAAPYSSEPPDNEITCFH